MSRRETGATVTVEVRHWLGEALLTVPADEAREKAYLRIGAAMDLIEFIREAQMSSAAESTMPSRWESALSGVELLLAEAKALSLPELHQPPAAPDVNGEAAR